MRIIDTLLMLSLIIYGISFLCFFCLGLGAMWGGSLKNFEDVVELYKNRVVKLITLTTLFSGIFLFVGGAIFTKVLETGLKKELGAFDSSRDRLYLNDKRFTESKQLIKEITSNYRIRSNHSSPTREIRLKAVVNKKEINLTLARDSRDSSVYWVFASQYRFFRDNEVWKVRTSLFNTDQ